MFGYPIFYSRLKSSMAMIERQLNLTAQTHVKFYLTSTLNIFALIT